MKVQKEVQRVWKSLSRCRRRGLRAMAKGNPDAAFRCRCQIVIGLVQGRSVTTIADVLQCSSSQVYRVAHRFLEEGESGLADRREDNGDQRSCPGKTEAPSGRRGGTRYDHRILNPSGKII